MDSLESDDQLTIINRSTEHRISKKLIRRIPYFDRMLSHDLLESKENKVKLDFDEQTFKIILNWIEMDLMLIKMDNVINLCNMADYFGINDDLMKDCATYFHGKFHISNLPVIIPQVTSISKLINSRVLNTFICRHFLKIVKPAFWLDFPFETIDYICKLDLMIDSEIKVFDAIMEWVMKWDHYSKRSHLKVLLNSVRWCHMESKHLTKVKENVLIKYEGFEPICSPRDVDCDCIFNRTKQEYFIVIEKLMDTDLRIKVLDSNFLPAIDQVIQLDISMPLHVVHDEHISDISFDSGRKMIRIDWKQNKYRLLDYKAYVSHHFEIARCFESRFVTTNYQDTKNLSDCQTIQGSSLLEANGKFVLFHIKDGFVAYWLDPKLGNINPKVLDYEQYFDSTILGENIYIITENSEFMTFKIGQEGELKIIDFGQLDQQLWFDKSFLTSSQVGNEIFLVDKSTKNIFRFNRLNEEWDPIGLLINYDYSKTEGQKKPSELLTFTTAFLSIDSIRPCLKRKLDSMN
ncbi:uncharacterized protein LOC112539774 [Tetranychus urticae]|uniref:uncharacterized protein LOC112539774 n=1 Tax=Tetranychus urticae TaxID=32264 RepID=UPI000D65D73A|nr:uncharacterized protein LOC112539774 [Tetranychus urticae]